MKEITGNIWELFEKEDVDAICITTNGVVKSNGELVMGAGIAKEASDRFPQLTRYFGSLVFLDGNIPHCFITDKEKIIFSFPTKNNYKNKSVLYLIENSCKELKFLVDYNKLKKVILPRPGCGLGGLKWDVVKPICEKYFDDRFFIINKKNYGTKK